MSNMSLNHRRHEDGTPQLPETYSPKPQKHWANLRPVDYMLKEQRLVFVLLGMALATAFFLLQPTGGMNSMPHVSNQQDRGHWIDLESPSHLSKHPLTGSFGGKIPLGLKSKSLRIVVTGGAGFVGSHLVDRLMERGDSVIVLDNFFTGRKENLQQHFGNPRFELIRHDVVEPILLEVDQIYHLACPASPVHYKFNPVKTIISSSISS